MDKIKKTILVNSSNGLITVHAQTGEVESVVMFEEGDASIHNIAKFDLNEYRDTYAIDDGEDLPSRIDILDLAYTLTSGEYVVPDMVWRIERGRFSFNSSLESDLSVQQQRKPEDAQQQLLSLPIRFLDYDIKMTSDGLVVSKDGLNAMPGACTFGTDLTNENVDRAKRSALLLFMIARPDDFEGAIYWRLSGRGGAYHEWFTLKQVLNREGMTMPTELQTPADGLNMMIGFKGTSFN